MKKILYTTLLAASIVTPFSVPFFAHADNTPVQVTASTHLDTGQPESHYSYQFLVPIDILLKTDASGTVQLATQANTENDPFTTYIQNAIKLAIGVAGLMGVIRLIQVGFTVIFESGNVNAVTKVKKELGAIVGSLVLVAGSWVILNTINPLLITQNLLIQPEIGTTTAMRKSICDDPTVCEEDVPTGADGKPMIVDAGGQPIPGTWTMRGFKGPGFYYMVIRQGISAEQGAGYQYFQGPFSNSDDCQKSALSAWDNHSTEHPNFSAREHISCVNLKKPIKTQIDEQAEANYRAMLKSGNVTWLHNACYQFSPCTNLSGLDAGGSGVLQMVIDFQKDCTAWNKGKQCKVQINGGTEPGHETHEDPYHESVDIEKNNDTNGFLWAKSPLFAQAFNTNKRFLYVDSTTGQGWWWVDEKPGTSKANSGSHFHICPNGGGPYASNWSCTLHYAPPTSSSDTTILEDFSNCDLAGKNNPANSQMRDCRWIIDGPGMKPRFIPDVGGKQPKDSTPSWNSMHH